MVTLFVKRTCYAWTGLCVLLFLTLASPATCNPDGPAVPFGSDGGVADDANDIFAWFEEGAKFTWGQAPAWASYCDILAINASQNAENYSIWVTFGSAVNLTRIATRFAGVRIFVNLTQLPLNSLNATLELVLGGNIFKSGEASNYLSYAQVANKTHSFNATNVAEIVGSVVNFSFPLTLSNNITQFEGVGVVKASIADWSAVAWSWDFFNSTAAFTSGNLIWDGYGDPEFRENWGNGEYTFPFIGAFDLGILGASIAVGVFLIRKRVRMNGGK